MIHLVVSAGVFQISLRPQKIQPRGRKEEQTNNMDLGLLQAQESEFCVTLHSPCIRRLSPACILRETSTKGTNNADIFSRWLTRPLCSSSGLSSLWTANSKLTALLCPPLSTVSLRLPLSTALLSFLGPSSPRPLPVSREISSSSPLFGFPAKTDKETVCPAPTPT